MKFWTRRIRRLEAGLAMALRRQGGVVTALALFTLAGFVVLVEAKYFQHRSRTMPGHLPGAASPSAATDSIRC